jgi:hypothetical protein
MSININRQEWIWLILVSLIVVTFSSFPYIGAYQAETSNELFNGAVYDRLDFAGYLATMRRGASGEWFYEFPFTSERQEGVFIRTPYIVLGHLSKLSGISIIRTYHLARLSLSLAACIGIYFLAAFSFEKVFSRRTAFLLAVGGSGLGWLQLLFDWVPLPDISPIDFWLIDAYPFFGFMTFPHFSAMLACMVFQIFIFLSYLSQSSFWKLLLVILFGVLIQPINPYLPILGDLAILGATIVHGFRNWHQELCHDEKFFNLLRHFKVYSLAAIALSQLPFLIYSIYIIHSDPVWRGFTNQALTLTPPPVYILWGFGLLWFFATIGIWKVLRFDFTPSFAAMLFWLVSGVFLSFVPLVFQRRFLFGAVVPLGFLGAKGISTGVLPWLKRVLSQHFARYVNSISWFITALTMMSSFYLSLGGVLYAASRPPELFDTAEMVAVADWLSRNAYRDDVILSSEITGRMITQRTGLTVYLGHIFETLDYEKKSKSVEAFFEGEISLKQLPSCGCQWLVYRKTEDDLDNFDSSTFNLVYQNSEFSIYQIQP